MLLLEAGPWDQECPGKKPTQNSDTGRMGRTWHTPITACRSPTPQKESPVKQRVTAVPI